MLDTYELNYREGIKNFTIYHSQSPQYLILLNLLLLKQKNILGILICHMLFKASLTEIIISSYSGFGKMEMNHFPLLSALW